ncbi:MAG: dockerin type I repeat-containing protein [Clostridia bacterium]|nr:dockerin type I repeat-containing protein [Clostridia bacterium]
MKKVFGLLLALVMVLSVITGTALAEQPDVDVLMLYDCEEGNYNGYQGVWGEGAGPDRDYCTEGTAGWGVQSFADRLMFSREIIDSLGYAPNLEEYAYIEFDIMSYYDLICDLETCIVRNAEAQHGSDHELFEIFLPAETFVHVKLPLDDFVVYSMENRDKWDTLNDTYGGKEDPEWEAKHYSGYARDYCYRMFWKLTYMVDPAGLPTDDNYVVFDNVVATRNGEGEDSTVQYWADVKPPEEPNKPDQPITSPTDTPTNTDVLALGDINGDQSIDAKDALVALRIAVEKYLPTDDEKVAADVNKDKAVDAKDALEILKYAVKKPSALDQ